MKLIDSSIKCTSFFSEIILSLKYNLPVNVLENVIIDARLTKPDSFHLNRSSHIAMFSRQIRDLSLSLVIHVLESVRQFYR